MTSPWRIQTIVTTTGERLPVLIDRDTGVPLFNPTVYALTEVRAPQPGRQYDRAASGSDRMPTAVLQRL